MKRLVSTLLAGAIAATSTSLADAHASLDRATPAVGSAVHGSPSQLKLWFTQRLEPAFSKVRVLDGNGIQVDKGDSEVDRTDATLLRVSLPKLSPGRYRVKWRVLSVDTHVSEGAFTFDVARQ
jgi:copper resistance protein C